MKKNPNKNKRAFTLTELLIVVIVIGVLSAVTLPKFNRVIENRKVTEAEEMMSAVRTEQERRCAMDKNYTLKFDNLADVISSSDTKNYKYSLQTEGISATSNKGKYTLKMLSYQDGSFCCTGDDCAKLNKNYPSCDGLTFPSSGCGGTDGTVEITPDPTPTPEPTPTPAPSCEGSQPADKVKDCACGTVKASYSCSAATNYKWVLGAFPDCPAKPADENDICPNGTVRTKSYACVNGTWTAGNWDKECSRCNESERLNCKDQEQQTSTGGGKVFLKLVHYVWDEANCSCSCPSSANAGLCSTGWDPDTCNCRQGPKYYFKCVTRVTVPDGGVPYGGVSSYAEAKTACEQGIDTSVEYYRYLSGGKPKPGCKPYEDKSGRFVDCALTPAYYIKYVCSTEPAKKNDGWGFDEVTCMVRQMHEDRNY